MTPADRLAEATPDLPVLTDAEITILAEPVPTLPALDALERELRRRQVEREDLEAQEVRRALMRRFRP